MGEFIKISYTARIKEGKIFDTTDEKVAKDAGIFNKDAVYKPLSVVLGEKQIIQGLEDALKEMKVGEEKKNLEISPEKAFGMRNPNLVRLVPMALFKKQKINPIPGMVLQLDGRLAKIQTVAGGRVRVDFNSELAGKTVVYDVKVEAIAKTKVEKVKFLVDRSFNSSDDFGIDLLREEVVKISLPEEAFKDKNILLRKASLAAEIFKFLDIDEIIFEENWKRKKEEEEKNKEEIKDKR